MVAAGRHRSALRLVDRDAMVLFVRRDVTRLDTQRYPHELGEGWITTVEQTVLDLAARPELGGLRDDAEAAARVLLARADTAALDDLATAQRRQATLRRLRGLSMLDPDEERSVAAAFGVATSQVRRDHFISHVLAALSERFADRLLFFGGTALSADLDGALPRAPRREFPGSAWRPALSEVRDEAEPASLIGPDGTTVRVQLLRRTGSTAPRRATSTTCGGWPSWAPSTPRNP